MGSIRTTQHYANEWTAIETENYAGPDSANGSGDTEIEAILHLAEQVVIARNAQTRAAHGANQMPSTAEYLHAMADAATIVMMGTHLVTRKLPPRHQLDLPRWGWSLYRGDRCLAYASGMATAGAAREHAMRWGVALISDNEI